MNSPASGSEQPSSSFFLLDERIRRWIWEAGWNELRDVQEQAIALIVSSENDVIVAASTAAGKTEAAFLPVLTRLLQEQPLACVLYVSPLKALINDQWGRLEGLCAQLEVPVIPWHGDIAGSRKRRFLKRPEGVLLITPESLEAILMNRGHGLAGIFTGLRCVVIDEMHAFIGTERGKQLQSLLHRIEHALQRRIQRIALSATLGDMALAAEYLRPGDGASVSLIESKDDSGELKVLVKGYLEQPPRLSAVEIANKKINDETADSEDTISLATQAVAEDLFKTLRGSNNLVFPNSRNRVEFYSDLLRRHCEHLALPNEFWPHHGSLAKEIREETESALKSRDLPATAICTTTLELGIDIGVVRSIAQIGPAPSVASLRQRLGRSGRRKGEPAILRAWCIEHDLTPKSGISDLLREGLVQTIAQIRLLVQGWYEPPRATGMHLSTLIQQLLSAVAQYGGLMVPQAWDLLCETGPFPNVSKRDFALLLRDLGKREVLMQDPTGLLLPGPLGEKMTGHYTFYAAFNTEEEFRLVTRGKTLGSLPVAHPLEENSYVIFAGRRWQVLTVDVDKKVIEVIPNKGGRPPSFEGMGGKVHDRVREEMRQVLAEETLVPFLDVVAAKLLAEARENYRRLGLKQNYVLPSGGSVRIFLWKGDWVMDTVALALRHKGLNAENEGLCIHVKSGAVDLIADTLRDFSAGALPTAEELVVSVLNKVREKWDGLLPDRLLTQNFASHHLDIPSAISALGVIAPRCRSAPTGLSG